MNGIKLRCPRTGANATVEGCAECWQKKLSSAEKCEIFREMGRPHRDRGAFDPEDGVSPRRRGCGCLGIVIGLVMVIMGITWGRECETWGLVGGLGFIGMVISICVAFPLFAEAAGAIGTVVMVGSTVEKAVRNLAEMDKKD